MTVRSTLTPRSLVPLALAGLVLCDLAHAQPSRARIEARRHMLNAEINTHTFRSMSGPTTIG